MLPEIAFVALCLASIACSFTAMTRYWYEDMVTWLVVATVLWALAMVVTFVA